MTISTIPLAHPAAALFPTMNADEFSALRQSVREHGQQEAVVMHEGAILDGRHRWRACTEEGLTPRTRNWSGECGSPTAFVIAMNLSRRHLTASQRAAVAIEALPMFEAEAAKRRERIGREAAERQHHPDRVVQTVEQPSALNRRTPAAVEQAAKAAGTNRQYVSDAKAIKAEAPDVFEQVRSGELTIPKAKKAIEKRQGEANIATEAALLTANGADTDAAVRAVRISKKFAAASRQTGEYLLTLPAAEVAAALDEPGRAIAVVFIREVRAWIDDLDQAVTAPTLRLIGA